MRVTDYGIRGMHLAYDLLEEWDALVLVDAVPDRGSPGTVHVFEADHETARTATGLDAHSMDPAAVFASLRALGGTAPRTVVGRLRSRRCLRRDRPERSCGAQPCPRRCAQWNRSWPCCRPRSAQRQREVDPMCLGIPGQVIGMLDGYGDQLALVDVAGESRKVNIGMLPEETFSAGDWVIIHMGFVVEKTDKAGADAAMAGLQLMGSGLDTSTDPAAP